MNSKLASKGKFISYVLRHGVEETGISIDREGWVSCEDLLNLSYKRNYNITYSELVKIVQENDKKRYELSKDGSKIRALQGHSSKEVSRTFNEEIPKGVLYHGTATQYVDAILASGLNKMSRQYVHLSKDIKTATAVGNRHGKLVMLEIDTAEMIKDGFKFYLSENDVWLVESVPSKYIKIK